MTPATHPAAPSAAAGTEEHPAVTGADFRIVSKGASTHEVAAVTAVLRAALDELAAHLDAEARPVVSAWQRSQRSIREPLRPGQGAWRSFSG